MVGGKWTSKEIFQKKALIKLHELFAAEKDAKKVYLKFEKKIKSTVSKVDRVRFLKTIAVRDGHVFRIKEKSTEEQLLYLLFNRPLQKKYVQKELL